MAGPLVLLTALGFVGILFIYSCARESELDLQVRYAQRRTEQLRGEQQALCVRINQVRDPAILRQVAVQQGMVFTPAGVDRVRLSRPLPPSQTALSPLAEVPLTPSAPPTRLPATSFARAPEGRP